MFALLLKTFEYLAPLSTLTYLSGKLTDAKLGGFTQWLIHKFIKTYKIDVTECLEPDVAKYETFNDFFVRKLKPEARPIDHKCIAISPVDGTVGQAGDVKAGRLIQAKGIDYSLKGLLGGHDQDLACFDQGRFCCTYLSPANYHRIHMPLDGTLVRTIHIPGRHFPVGRRNVSNMPDLFTQNERLVCFFNTTYGPFALVMVGAAMVGSIVTTWDGRIVRRNGLEVKNFTPNQYQFKKGEEIGMFKFGSTVICVWPQNLGNLNQLMVHGQVVKMGQAMIGEGEIQAQSPTAQNAHEQTATSDATTAQAPAPAHAQQTQTPAQASNQAAVTAETAETAANTATTSDQETSAATQPNQNAQSAQATQAANTSGNEQDSTNPGFAPGTNEAQSNAQADQSDSKKD